MKSIKKGKYYWHSDSSVKKLHPSYIYGKNDRKNSYKIVMFTSSRGRHRTKLKENIDPKSRKDCYVLRTPKITKRKYFGGELKDFQVKNKRDKALIKYIANKKK